MAVLHFPDSLNRQIRDLMRLTKPGLSPSQRKTLWRRAVDASPHRIRWRR